MATSMEKKTSIASEMDSNNRRNSNANVDTAQTKAHTAQPNIPKGLKQLAGG